MSNLLRLGIPERIVLAAFGLPFAAIGGGIVYGALSVFGGPASFAALFGLPFLAMGLYFVFCGITGRAPSTQGGRVSGLEKVMARVAQARSRGLPDAGPLNLDCAKCGASVSDQSEISPSGDVKCTHCGAWFSVRR